MAAAKPPKESTVPQIIIDKARAQKPKPAVSLARGKVSAQGVFAEIDTVLANHRQKIEPVLTQGLNQKIRTLLPSLGIKSQNEEQFLALSHQIAQNTSQQTLEDLGKIQEPEQINQVIADNLTQALFSTPQIAISLKKGQQETFEKVAAQTLDMVQANQKDLEKAAVLENINQLAQFANPSSNVSSLVSDQIDSAVATQAPLLSPKETATLQATLGSNYLADYLSAAQGINLNSTQTLQQLKAAKDEAHNFAVQNAQNNLNTAQSQLPQKIDIGKLFDDFGSAAGLKPITPQAAAAFGLVNVQPNTNTFTKPATGFSAKSVGLVLTAPKPQQEAYFSLLAYNKPKLDGKISKISSRLNQLSEKIKNKKSLTFKEHLQLKSDQDRLALLQKAKNFPVKEPKRFKTYLSYFQSLPTGKKLDWASASVWTSTEAFLGQYPGVFIPKSVAAGNERLMAGKAWGSLSFGLGNFHMGVPHPSFGMGANFSGGAFLKSAGISIFGSVAQRIAKTGSLAFGAMALYFMSLGKAAFAGFMAGAAIGGIAGAGFGGFLGFQVAAATGPFAPLVGAVTIPAGAFAGGAVGGLVGGLAGGLIGYGLAAGSATAVSMGIGAGAGGIIGGYVGGTTGAAAGGAIAGGLTVATGGLAAPLAPIIVATSTLVGAAIGAIVGAFLGAGIGYLVGNFIVPIFTGAANFVGNIFGSASAGVGTGVGSIGGLLSGALNGLAGLASAAWGGFTSAAGGLFGALSGAASGFAGFVGSLGVGISGTGIAYAAVGGIATVGATGIIVGVVTAATFFSNEADQAESVSGDNQFYTVTKKPDKSHIENPPPSQDITFTITLTAKALKLTNVQITDDMKVQGKDTNLTITQDKSGNPLSPITSCQHDIDPSQNCTAKITISADERFNDSVITNTVHVKATPEGQPEKADSTTAIVTVGNPPANCPRGWPTTGTVTQGPDGHFTFKGDAIGHGDLGYEAIDIGTTEGTPVYATVEGTVTNVWGDGENHSIAVQPTSCAGLQVVYYQHLLTTSVHIGDTLTFGQQIGTSGNAGTGPHIHYEFNNPNDRSFPIEPPNIPTFVPRTCEDNCGVQIQSAP